MFKTNEKGEGGFINLWNKLFSKKDKNPDQRSTSENYDRRNDFQVSIPNAPKRKIKGMAPQPPTEPSRSTQNYDTNVNDIEQRFSELTLSDRVNNSKQVTLAQVHIESESTESKLKKTKHTKSSKTNNESNAVSEKKRDLNSNDNHNVIKNCQVQKNSKNTKSNSFVNKKISKKIVSRSKTTTVKKNEVVPQRQTNPKNDKPTMEIKSSSNEQTNIIAKNLKDKEVENNSPQILQNETHQKESTNCNIRNKDEANRLVREEIENKNESKIALEKIESAMQEEENLKMALHNEVENILSQILENETHELESTKCNISNEDEANRSLREETENNNKSAIALEKIESVMQELENFKLDIQKLNNLESFYVIEMGLTDAIIKLDSIQMPKNELLKKTRKEGISLIHEMFKQLDEQGKKIQT